MIRPGILSEIEVVVSICRKLGLGEVAPSLERAAHHTTLLVRPYKIVARGQSNQPIAFARHRAVHEIAIARHLATHNAPTLAPLDILSGPYVTASSVVTFWPHIAHDHTADEGDAALAATTLIAVHRALSHYDGPLPSYTQALDRCWAVLTSAGSCPTLSADDRSLLKTEFQRLRVEVERAPYEHVPLHGDAHLGNLLMSESGPIWLDFEEACSGPREYDISSLPPEAWPSFTDADPVLIEACSDLKSVCVAVWCSADMSRSAEIREAAAFHLQRVRDFRH